MSERVPRPIFAAPAAAVIGLAVLAAPAALLACRPAPSPAPAEAPIAILPLHGATYRFRPPHGLRLTVKVISASFPREVRISWTGGLMPRLAGAEGTRTLTGLARGKRFAPAFADGEDVRTDATAPWVSERVCRLLGSGTPVIGFREEAALPSGQPDPAQKQLRLDRDAGATFFKVTIDGRPARVRAFSANHGMLTIADDPGNPLVLEYRAAGAGWRLASVSTR
jgi:hypothetical protein